MTSQDDEHWMSIAVGLAWECPPSPGAFSVGAVVVGQDGTRLSDGYSRENDPRVHAEESALAKLAGDDQERLEAVERQIPVLCFAHDGRMAADHRLRILQVGRVE